MALPRVPGEDRADFIVKIFSVLMAHGTRDMSEAELAEIKKKMKTIMDDTARSDVAENGTPSAPKPDE